MTRCAPRSPCAGGASPSIAGAPDRAPCCSSTAGRAGRRRSHRWCASCGMPGARIVAFDAPAHGLSSGRQTDVRDYAAIISELARAHDGFEAIVAHSFGTPGAAQAIRSGIRVGKLVTVNGAADFEYLLQRFASTLGLRRSSVLADPAAHRAAAVPRASRRHLDQLLGDRGAAGRGAVARDPRRRRFDDRARPGARARGGPPGIHRARRSRTGSGTTGRCATTPCSTGSRRSWRRSPAVLD